RFDAGASRPVAGLDPGRAGADDRRPPARAPRAVAGRGGADCSGGGQAVLRRAGQPRRTGANRVLHRRRRAAAGRRLFCAAAPAARVTLATGVQLMFPMDVPCHRRSRVPATLLALCCAWLPLSAVAADRPEDFAAQAALALEGEGPWYRLDVPMAVHLAAAHGDLRDLRIFDADGQTQAYHLGSGREQYRETRQETAVTRFPLYARRNSQDVPEVRIRRGEGGTLVEVAPPARQDPEVQQLRGWLLDGSAVQDSLQQLVLDWDEQEGEGFQLL